MLLGACRVNDARKIGIGCRFLRWYVGTTRYGWNLRRKFWKFESLNSGFALIWVDSGVHLRHEQKANEDIVSLSINKVA